MIRERVNIHGLSRPMEPPEEIAALQLRPGQIGIIKEAPTIRWLKGQEDWDKRFKHNAQRAIKQRSKLEAKAKRLLENAHSQGLILNRDVSKKDLRRSPSQFDSDATDGIQDDRRWGPLDLEDEMPPPTAIAKRRDTVSVEHYVTRWLIDIYH
jgi:hypothetical protein